MSIFNFSKITLLFSFLTAGLTHAASISVGKGFSSGVNVLSFPGGPAIKDFSFAIGTFAADPAADATFAQVMASFKEFGRTSSPLVNGADTIIAVSTPFTNAPANAGDFNGKPIYIVVGTNGLSDTGATQFAVIKAENPAAGKWVFPSNVAVADAGDAPMNSASNFTAIIGGKIDNASGVDSLYFIVPEPSGMGLLGVAALLGSLKRSKRKISQES